jgi:hypothetical protein
MLGTFHSSLSISIILHNLSCISRILVESQSLRVLIFIFVPIFHLAHINNWRFGPNMSAMLLLLFPLFLLVDDAGQSGYITLLSWISLFRTRYLVGVMTRGHGSLRLHYYALRVLHHAYSSACIRLLVLQRNVHKHPRLRDIVTNKMIGQFTCLIFMPLVHNSKERVS